MRRRGLLAAVAGGMASVAGCSTGRGSGNTATPTPDGEETGTPTGTPGRSPAETPHWDPDGPFDDVGSLVDLRTVDRTLSILSTGYRSGDGAEVRAAFSATATADGPARIAGTLTNGNGFGNTFRLRRMPLFDAVPSAWPGTQSGDEGYTYRDELYLAPTGGHELATAVPAYERDDDGRWRLSEEISGPWFPELKRLDPGETVRIEYALVGHPEATGFPAERYRFGPDEPSITIAAWPTSAPGPTTDPRFEGATPPALPDAKGMAWYHEAGPETAASLRPSAERAALPARLDFTLVNHGRKPLTGNPYFWKLHKYHDGEWFHVAPWGWPAPLSAVSPGGAKTWTLRAFAEHTVPCDDGHEVGFLGGGRYAFEVGMSRGERTHAALVELVGPAVTIAPTDGLETERDGETVRVTSSYRPDGERATLVLRRADTADGTLVAEQVMQPRNRGLRNTLAFLESDVGTVRLETHRNVASRAALASGYENASRRFRFRGQAYEARAGF